MTGTILTSQRLWFFAILQCFLVWNVEKTTAQNIQQYEGGYVVNKSTAGKAKFNYFIKANDTILHGDFYFSKVSVVENENNTYRSIEYYGAYKNNKKEGSWVFAQKTIKPQEEYFIDDLHIKMNASGKVNLVRAYFKEGVAIKEWKLSKYTFKNSKAIDTTHTATINFKNGSLHGRFVSRSKDLNIEGVFNNGLMDNDWLFERKSLTEKRSFDLGVLKELNVQLKNNSFTTTKTKVQFIGLDTTYRKDNLNENWEKIDFDQSYAHILEKSAIRTTDEVEFNTQIEQSIYQSNASINQTFRAFSFAEDLAVWKNNQLEFPKVKVRKIEFTDNEVDLISLIQEKYTLSEEKIEQLLVRENLEIAKLNFKKINKIEALFQIYKNKLEDLESSLNLVTSPVFEYMKRDEILAAYKVEVTFPETVNYSFEGKQVTDEYNFPTVEMNAFNLNYMAALTSKFYKDISILAKESDNIFNQLHKQESLSENEEILITTKKEVKNFFLDKENEEYNTYHDYFSNTVVAELDRIIVDYGKMDLDEKKNKVENYIECLNSFKELKEDLIEFQSKVTRIDDEYVRVVFNPFLMSDISERVKEKIYEPYEEYLLPYILEDIKNNLDCENIDQKKENLEIIYNSMLEIRKKDTKEEERKLRRVKDVQKILSILNIELH